MDEHFLTSLPIQFPLGLPILTLTGLLFAFAPASLPHGTRMGAQTGEAIAARFCRRRGDGFPPIFRRSTTFLPFSCYNDENLMKRLRRQRERRAVHLRRNRYGTNEKAGTL